MRAAIFILVFWGMVSPAAKSNDNVDIQLPPVLCHYLILVESPAFQEAFSNSPLSINEVRKTFLDRNTYEDAWRTFALWNIVEKLTPELWEGLASEMNNPRAYQPASFEMPNTGKEWESFGVLGWLNRHVPPATELEFEAQLEFARALAGLPAPKAEDLVPFPRQDDENVDLFYLFITAAVPKEPAWQNALENFLLWKQETLFFRNDMSRDEVKAFLAGDLLYGPGSRAYSRLYAWYADFHQRRIDAFGEGVLSDPLLTAQVQDFRFDNFFAEHSHLLRRVAEAEELDAHGCWSFLDAFFMLHVRKGLKREFHHSPRELKKLGLATVERKFSALTKQLLRKPEIVPSTERVVFRGQLGEAKPELKLNDEELALLAGVAAQSRQPGGVLHHFMEKLMHENPKDFAALRTQIFERFGQIVSGRLASELVKKDSKGGWYLEAHSGRLKVRVELAFLPRENRFQFKKFSR